jgi:hypothetical protein
MNYSDFLKQRKTVAFSEYCRSYGVCHALTVNLDDDLRPGVQHCEETYTVGCKPMSVIHLLYQ